MELTANVVSECVARVEGGFDAVIIPEFSVGEGFWAKCRALEKQCYVGDDLIEAARFFRKSTFGTVGGFDAELEAGEDWDLNQRIRKAGFQTTRISAFIKHHEDKLSLRETMLKKHQYGRTLRRYQMKHPEEAKQQLRLLRPAFLKNWRTLTKNPIHSSGMVLMKACEFIAMTLA
jgi:arabinofuranan 3-O-arabinosyltransferase